MNLVSTPPQHPIARRLILGFVAVAALSIVMCLILLQTIWSVSHLVTDMRDGESPIHRGLELSSSVREQSLHIAHAVIERDESQLDRYEKSRERTRALIQEIAAEVPGADSERLQLLAQRTQQLHDEFVGILVPHIRKGNWLEAGLAHGRLEILGEQAAEQADIFTQNMESKMAQAHVEATDTTRFGFWIGLASITLIVTISAAFARSVENEVVKPLRTLVDSARRFGEGEFGHRVGNIGEGEIGELSRALDAMAREISEGQQRVMSQERMAAIGQLAAGVAHELNNPIGIIRGYLKTMTPQDDPITLGEELAILDDEAAQCQRIAEDLLWYSRASGLEITDAEMSQYLEEVRSRFSESPHGRDVLIELKVKDAKIPLDKARIRQVLFNLLANAVQASTGRQPVTLMAGSEDDFYVIQVSDDGAGVAEAQRQRVFEPFYSKRKGGTGLGLAVALGIVEMHGGRIEVGEGPEGGALFRVLLPLSGTKDGMNLGRRES